MAFLLNLFFRSINVKQDNLVVFCSAVMFLSYFLSDHFYELFDHTEVYWTWFIYDCMTFLIVLIGHKICKRNASPGVIYTYIGLSINTLLFLAMHIDIVIMKNKETWFLWDVYSTGVNIIDFAMIIALITDRDSLSLIKLYSLIKGKINERLRQLHN